MQQHHVQVSISETWAQICTHAELYILQGCDYDAGNFSRKAGGAANSRARGVASYLLARISSCPFGNSVGNAVFTR